MVKIDNKENLIFIWEDLLNSDTLKITFDGRDSSYTLFDSKSKHDFVVSFEFIRTSPPSTFEEIVTPCLVEMKYGIIKIDIDYKKHNKEDIIRLYKKTKEVYDGFQQRELEIEVKQRKNENS